MNFVVDQMLVNFTDVQYEFNDLEKAIEFAKALSEESNSIISISNFDGENSTHLFEGGICYKPYNPRGFSVVK
jgi:hypothetical protein